MDDPRDQAAVDEVNRLNNRDLAVECPRETGRRKDLTRVPHYPENPSSGDQLHHSLTSTSEEGWQQGVTRSR